MTLATSRTLRHPQEIRISTPILIPSFSSKGFGDTRNGESEIGAIFRVAEEYLTESMLISAFDIYHNNLSAPETAITELTFVDSGGYEIADYYDFSTKYRQPLANQRAAEEWSEEKLTSVYDDWPEAVPAAFVSFDHPSLRQRLDDQIDQAQDLLGRYRDQLRVILVKPETEDQVQVQVSNIIAHASHFDYFDIVGFTENELGNSLLNRMESLARIRLAFDDAGVSSPIHVFGGLDPLSCGLYYCAGAEIFDGLTWLRYGYSDGAAVYHQNYAARSVGIDRTDWFARAKASQDNIGSLIDLRNDMRKFANDNDYDHFGENAELLRQSFDLLATRIERI